MRTSAPQLLPIFRSEGQGRLLARVYLQPENPSTVAGIARELGLDDGGLTREADRLERAGLIRSERVGRSRTLLPNDESPYHRDLYNLLLKAFGPATVLAAELRKVDGVEQAYLYGSWAARYAGEPGPDPVDLDVIVVGNPSSGLELNDIASDVFSRLGRDLSFHVVEAADWQAAKSGFLQEIKSRPLVPIDLGRGGA
jgi:predicted nucleotidyltransferase